VHTHATSLISGGKKWDLRLRRFGEARRFVEAGFMEER
jgi:hypothetical protein